MVGYTILGLQSFHSVVCRCFSLIPSFPDSEWEVGYFFFYPLIQLGLFLTVCMLVRFFLFLLNVQEFQPIFSLVQPETSPAFPKKSPQELEELNHVFSPLTLNLWTKPGSFIFVCWIVIPKHGKIIVLEPCFPKCCLRNPNSVSY